MRDDGSFVERMKSFMGKCTIVRKSAHDTDCCGREITIDCVVSLPLAIRDEFLDFIKDYSYDENVLNDGKEHYFVRYSVGDNLNLYPTNRDYDGFIETDYDCVKNDGLYVCASLHMMVRGEVPEYDWRTGVRKVSGIQDHPVGGIPGFDVQRYGYSEFFCIDHPWGMSMRTFIIFK